MDKLLHADGRDYLHKETIIQLYNELNTLDKWLVRQPPSKTLDLVYSMKLCLGMFAQHVYQNLEPAAPIPDGLGEYMHKHVAENEDFTKKHLMKRPCKATGVDYDTLIEHYNTVFGEFE
jgi:hypothetical protein